MNETITIGQKIGFAMVIAFVLALSSTPFLSQNSKNDGSSAKINDGVMNARRVVAVR